MAEITQTFSLETKVIFFEGFFQFVGFFPPVYFSDLTHTIASQSPAQDQLKG